MSRKGYAFLQREVEEGSERSRVSTFRGLKGMEVFCSLYYWPRLGSLCHDGRVSPRLLTQVKIDVILAEVT